MKPEEKPYMYSSRSEIGPIHVAIDISVYALHPAKNKSGYRGCEPSVDMNNRRAARHDLDIKNDRESIRSIDGRFANICRRGNEYHREP